MAYILETTKADNPFGHWHNVLSHLDNSVYAKEQTPESLNALSKICRSFQPSIIVELGTSTGLSLRAWTLTAPDTDIIALSPDFSAFEKSIDILPVDLSRVTLVKTDILSHSFDNLWTQRDKVLFFVHAPASSGGAIIRHVLKNAVPRLPDDSLVVVDNIWHSPEHVISQTAEQIFHTRMTGELDPLQSHRVHYAPYHGAGTFWGFDEVMPLLSYVNRYRIQLGFSRKNKHVFFHTRKGLSPSPFDEKMFEKQCGLICYDPLDGINSGNRFADRVLPGIKDIYNRGEHKRALKLLLCLQEKDPAVPGLSYALAVTLAKTGQLRQAEKALLAELDSPSPHPLAATMLHNLRKRFFQHRADDKERRSGVTFFTMPKAFRGLDNALQRNAIQSWLHLAPRPEVILLGNEEGVAKTAAEFGLRHIPNIARNEFGTPLVDDMFLQVQNQAETDVLCYVDASLVLFDDFMQALEKCRDQNNFLLVGCRLNYDQTEEINFASPQLTKKLASLARSAGIPHEPTVMDYFAFKPGLWDGIPPFAFGKRIWDSWLFLDAAARGCKVVDCSDFITALHQNHDSGQQPEDIEKQRNLAFMPGVQSFCPSVHDAPYRLDGKGRICCREFLAPAI